VVGLLADPLAPSAQATREKRVKAGPELTLAQRFEKLAAIGREDGGDLKLVKSPHLKMNTSHTKRSKLMLTRRRFAQALSLPLTMAVALLAFTSTWGAEAQPIQDTGPAPSKQPVLTTRKPDIEVSITAFSDAAGTQPVSNGGSLGNCGRAWFRFTIKNKGFATAKNFYYKMVVRKNDVKIYNPPAAQMTLNGGQSKSFFVETPGGFIPPSYELKALILGDIANFVNESNEANNKASFTLNGHCKIELPTPVGTKFPYPHTPISRSKM
jgi:hypothetical protein